MGTKQDYVIKQIATYWSHDSLSLYKIWTCLVKLFLTELFKKQSNFNKHLNGFVPHCMYGCWIAQVLFLFYSLHIWLIYMYFSCSQKLKQLNFDFTKCKIPIPRYINHVPWPCITRPFPCLSEQFLDTDILFLGI